VSESYTWLHIPEEPHVHTVPEPGRKYAGWIALCHGCGMALKCVDGDWWHWRPVSWIKERRLKRRAGIPA